MRERTIEKGNNKTIAQCTNSFKVRKQGEANPHISPPSAGNCHPSVQFAFSKIDRRDFSLRKSVSADIAAMNDSVPHLAVSITG